MTRINHAPQRESFLSSAETNSFINGGHNNHHFSPENYERGSSNFGASNNIASNYISNSMNKLNTQEKQFMEEKVKFYE